MDILSKLNDILNLLDVWFNQYIFSWAGGFVRLLATIFIKIFQICIDALQWVVANIH